MRMCIYSLTMRQDKTDKFVMMSSEMYIVCVFVVVVVDDCF